MRGVPARRHAAVRESRHRHLTTVRVASRGNADRRGSLQAERNSRDVPVDFRFVRTNVDGIRFGVEHRQAVVVDSVRQKHVTAPRLA